MATKALLYCDLLGTKSLYAERGIAAVQGRYKRFAQILGQSLDAARRDFGVQASSVELNSDAALLRFRSAEDGILAGCKLWVRAFLEDESDGSDACLALRGVLVRVGTNKALRKNFQVPGFPQITHWQQSSELLQAILFEQSGAKGMRLLAPGNYATKQVDSRTLGKLLGNEKVEQQAAQVTQTIATLTYPDETQGWKDVLWPLAMADRLGEIRSRSQQRSTDAKRNDAKEQHRATIKLVEASQKTAHSVRQF